MKFSTTQTSKIPTVASSLKPSNPCDYRATPPPDDSEFLFTGVLEPFKTPFKRFCCIGFFTLSLMLLISCGGGGGGGGSSSNKSSSSGDSSDNSGALCSRFVRDETTYHYPLANITHQATFSIEDRGSDGRELTASTKLDRGNDGTIDFSIKYTYQSHDNSGRPIRIEIASDNFNDGIIDERENYTITYDSNGNPLTRSREIDSNNNGTTDDVVKDSYVTDSSGNTFIRKSEYDDGNNGTIDRVLNVTYTYDSEGVFSSSLATDDTDNDGIPDETTKYTYTLIDNSDGTPDTHQQRRDPDNNGTVDQIITEKNYYESVKCRSIARRTRHEAFIFSKMDHISK